MKYPIHLLCILFICSCTTIDKKNDDLGENSPNKKDNEIFFIDVENDKVSDNIQINDEAIHEQIAKVSKTNDPSIYTVQKGDTLGIIAVKIYGDFRRWRHLYILNEDQIKNRLVIPGQDLKYNFREEDKWIKPSGTAYLVLKNDTLVSISKKIYQGSGKRWKYLWENNQKLIYNPNLIFTGFTLYYLPLKTKIAQM